MCYHPIKRNDDMGKFDKVLIATDYDGTLACSDGSISTEVKEKIAYFQSEGGLFTVCTGRTKQGFHAYSPEIINAPVLLANGSMAYDFKSEKTVYTNCIQKSDKAVLEKIIAAFPDICIEFYSDKFRSYAVKLDERSRRHFENQFIEYEEITELNEDMFPLVKVMAGAGKHTFELQDMLRETDTGDISFIPCDGHFVELVHRTSGKGSGLLCLADALGVAHKDVYSIGDGANDVDMHRVAAHAFVPSNGDKFALASAGTVVRSNNEGAVAHVIEILDSWY